MARETLASKQAVIDGLNEEVAALRARVGVNADDVRDIIREMMHTPEAEEWVEGLARYVAEDEAAEALRNLDIHDEVRDALENIMPYDIGAADEDHEHTVR